MPRSHTIDGHTIEDDREFLQEFEIFGVCDDCGGADTGYCFCCVSEGSADLERMRRRNDHEVAQAHGRVRQRSARENLWKFHMGVKVMIIANYWFLLPLRPGARGVERAARRFCAARVETAD
jgi:hypothetical protein